MEVMMRTYGGLFTDFTPISERLLGRRLYYDEKQITNMLRHMDALKAIVYKGKSDKPQITFTAPRIDTKDLYLSDSNYSQLKQHALEKAEAIKKYVLSNEGCRSRMLLDYFGEADSDPCGICDLCIQQRKQTLKNTEKTLHIRERLLELIAQTPRRADELVDALGDIDEEEVLRQLRLIVEERLAGINEKLQFYIP